MGLNWLYIYIVDSEYFIGSYSLDFVNFKF